MNGCRKLTDVLTSQIVASLCLHWEQSLVSSGISCTRPT